jgi:replication initiation protein RepC
MTFGSAFSELPAHPRHVSPAADHYREKFCRPPALDDKGLLPGHLLAAFKGAARYMGLRGNILVAMDYFFAMTRAQDWMGDAHPLVWPSAREQSEALGLSPSGVKFVNRRLIELGLIIAKDSPTGARWGRRGHNGQILEAYGFDLSPMAHRVEEFSQIRDAGRANDAVRAQLRRRKTVAIKSIGQIVRTAAESNIDTPPLYALAEGVYGIIEGLDPSADRPALERVVDDLEALRDAVYALYRDLIGQTQQTGTSSEQESRTSAMPTVDSNRVEPASGLPNNNYKLPNNLTDSIGHERGSSEFDKKGDSPAPQESATPGEIPVPVVKPKEVVRLAPALGTYISEDLDRVDMQRAIWAVIQAAESCAFRELSVSKSLWADAQKVMGLWPAALAVMVVAAKDPEYFSRTPAHYFAGMVARAKNGTLRLDRSIWGLRSKNDGQGGGA